MTPFEAYKLYLGLKLHFTTKKYDYFKYVGHVQAKIEAFNKRKDKLFFEKLSKHSDPKGFLISNFIENNNFWIGDMLFNEETEKIYIRWCLRISSLEYLFQEQIKTVLKEDFKAAFYINNNEHPRILKLFLQGYINIEILIILIDIIGCYSYMNKNLKDDVVWDHMKIMIKKYRPFLTYDKKLYRNILKTQLEVDK